MNITVMGAGAVGCYFGARLAQAGHQVAFVARRTNLQALQAHGLTIKSTAGDLRLERVTASDDAAALPPPELVLFTVKSQHTRDAAERLGRALPPDTLVLSLQNGVDNEEILCEILGDERVLGGVAYIEATVDEPGIVEHKSPFARIEFGELRGPPQARTEALHQLFKEAGIDATLSANVLSVKWAKWLFICAFSGVTALTRKPIGAVLADPDTALLYQQVMQEVKALADAKGIALPGTIVAERMSFSRTQLPPQMQSSLQQDLAKGKPLELEALNGYASRLGRELGVPTPVNDFIYAALKLHRHGS